MHNWKSRGEEYVQSPQAALALSDRSLTLTMHLGFGLQLCDLLQSELKKLINIVIQNESLSCLESVQALLVTACYSTERSLILSFATRMALDLGLHNAFEELTNRLAARGVEWTSDIPNLVDEDNILVRNSRTWFGLLVLDHM